MGVGGRVEGGREGMWPLDCRWSCVSGWWPSWCLGCGWGWGEVWSNGGGVCFCCCLIGCSGEDELTVVVVVAVVAVVAAAAVLVVEDG